MTLQTGPLPVADQLVALLGPDTALRVKTHDAPVFKLS
jgi:hypothetical protein